MPKAFIVFNASNVVINKIVPTDESVTVDDIKNSYDDPTVTVKEFADANDPEFLSTNAPEGGN